MTTASRLVANTGVVVAGTAAQRLLTFATTILIARGLGEAAFGTYAFVVAYMFLFGFVADIGFERVIARELARTPERTGLLMGTGFLLRGTLSVAAAAAAIGVAWLVDLPTVTRWCIVLAAIGLPLSVEALVRAFFQSRFEMQYVYLLSLPGGVVFVVLVGAILWLDGGLLGVFVAGLATGALSVGLLLWVALPRMRVVWRIEWRLVRYLWREAWELGVVIFIWLVTLRIDQLLLYWLRGPSDLGQYAVAVKVTEALNLIPEAIVVTVFPLLAAASREGAAPERLARIYRLTVRYLTAIVLPLAVVVWWERDRLLRVLFGAAYVAGGDALGILAWWMFFAYSGAVYVSLMMVRSQQRVLAIVSAVAAGVNIGLNVVWIPPWGATGAAAATLVSSAVSFLCFSVVPQTRAVMRVCRDEAVRPALAVASVLVVGLVVPDGLRLVLVLPLYGAALILLGGLGREDVALVRRLVAR